MGWLVVWQYRDAVAHGFAVTALISVIAIVGSFLGGTLLACLRLLQNPVLDGPITCYIALVRNLPVIVKVFFFYYIVGLDAFPAGLIALILHQSGYVSDVIAAGFRAIPPSRRSPATHRRCPLRQCLPRCCCRRLHGSCSVR